MRIAKLAAPKNAEIGTVTNQAKKIFEKILQSTAWRFRTRPTATTAPTYKMVISGHLRSFEAILGVAKGHSGIKKVMRNSDEMTI